VHHRKRVLGAMIDFARKQQLPLLRLLAVGDVDVTPLMREIRLAASLLAAAVPRHQRMSPSAGRCGIRPGRNGIVPGLPDGLAQQSPILAVNKLPKIAGRDLEGGRVDPEDLLLPSSRRNRHLRGPNPRIHLAGRKRQVAAILALLQAPRRAFQFRGAVGDPLLELGIELLEQLRFAVQLGENLDLGAQHFGNDGTGT